MARQSWRGPEPRGRINARPQNAEGASVGIRNAHYGMDGKLLGGITKEGQPLGTRISGGGGWRGSATPRLDAGPQTPGLDANPKREVRYTSIAELRQKDVDVARAAAANGDFGIAAKKKVDNLTGRQSLFSDMQKAGSGGITPEMTQRAKTLGVNQQGWRNGLSKLTMAPAAIAAPGTPAVVAKPMSLTKAPAPTMTGGPPLRPGAPNIPQKPVVATPAKTGGLEGTIADLGKARETTRAMLVPKTPRSMMPTPKLDASVVTMASPPPSPASTPPAAPVSPPAIKRSAAPMMALPKPNDSSAYWIGKGVKQAINNTGSMIKQGASAVRESMKGPDYSKPENAPSFTNAMVPKPLQFNSVKKPELSEGAKRAVRPVIRASRNFAAGFNE